MGTATAKRGQVTAGEASRRIVEKLIHVAVKNLARATSMKRSGYLGSLGWTIGDLYRRLDPAASDELIGDRVTATMMLIHAKEEAARAAWASDGGRA